MHSHHPSTAAFGKLCASAAVLGYFFLLAWFYAANVYQAHFFDHGGIVVAYQLARIIFIPYLLWLQYAVGAWILNRMRCEGGFIASCLMGTALWHVSLFAVGLAGGLTYPVMMLMTGSVMVASGKHLSVILRRAFARAQDLGGSCADAIASHRMTANEKMMVILVALAAVLFLLLKGTYPSGGHDFYNMYFPYYRAVVRDGGLGPNEVWFQYLYAKGAGLYFLSMILLDPLAIQLVSVSLIIVAACMVFDFLDSPSRNKLLPLFGVFLYVAFYIYTPGNKQFAFSGGWGDLEKTHELNAVLILGVLWLTQKIMTSQSFMRRGYAVTLALVCATAVLITWQVGFIIGAFLVSAGIYCWFTRYRPSIFSLFAAACSTALSMLLIALLNYKQMGIFNDQWIMASWPWIDWQKIVQQGATLELYVLWHNFYLHQQMGETDPGFSSLNLALSALRLYLWWPVLAIGAALAGIAFWTRRYDAKPGAMGVILLLFLTICFAITFQVKSYDQLSFFRLTSFAYAPVLIVGLLVWKMAPEHHIRKAIYSVLLLLVAVGIAGTSTALPRYFTIARKDWQQLITAAYRYNTGEYSLYEATSDLQGRSKNLASPTPLLGTHPAFKDIYDILPYRTRIWSLNNIAYCMLPACNVEHQYTMITSPRWYDIANLSIDDGKRILQEEHLNYIFYSTTIMDIPFADAKDTLSTFYRGLSPEHIADVYGIAWTNGVDYLLTWKSRDTKPLDEVFMASWKRYYKESVELRNEYFSLTALAPYIKQAAGQRDLKHPMPFE